MSLYFGKFGFGGGVPETRYTYAVQVGVSWGLVKEIGNPKSPITFNPNIVVLLHHGKPMIGAWFFHVQLFPSVGGKRCASMDIGQGLGVK